MPKPDGLQVNITLRAFPLCLAYVCVEFGSNCHKTEFDAKPDGLRMDITPRALDLCSISVCVG